jgi:hypothetical protein
MESVFRKECLKIKQKLKNGNKINCANSTQIKNIRKYLSAVERKWENKMRKKEKNARGTLIARNA